VNRGLLVRQTKGSMRRWQAVLALAACLFLVDPLVAERLSAQTTENEFGVLATRLEHVEHRLHGVQHQVYGDGQPIVLAANDRNNAGDDSPSDATTERLMERVNGLDDEVRNLTNQVEELGYQLRQLKSQFEQVTGANPQKPGAAQPAGGDQGASGAPQQTTPGAASGSNAGRHVLSNNSAGGAGLAPGETTIGQIPADSVTGPAPPAPKPASYKDQYAAALGYIRQQDYTQAETALKDFVAQHGETDLAGPAMYWLGEVYFVQNNYMQAAQTFVSELKKYPANPKAADSMLKLGMSLAALGNKDQACLTFGELPKKYPNASQTILQRGKVEAQRASCKAS
jgi:tol-pal system protein YbgF